MKNSIIILTILLSVNFLFAQNKEDLSKIKNTALDYIEGWYEADVKRMKHALHPKLAKRMVFVDSKTGKSKLRDLTTEQMLKYTREGGAKEIPIEQRNIEISILDALSKTASVKISSVKFTDYLHLIKWNNEWVIINVVWENK